MGTINKQMIMKSMQLNFNLSCWQNRRARIYLDGEDICDSKYLKIDMPILLVTDTKERSERLIFGGREICIFYEGSSKNFFELQVWKTDGLKQTLFASGTSYDPEAPTMRLEKLGVNKNRIYCTIDCDKGLKVQKLFLIGILKINNKLYISDETQFPPPSSKRKVQSEQRSSSPYSRSPEAPLSPSPTDAWKLLSDQFRSLGEQGEMYLYYLTRSVEFTADVDGRELQSSKEDIYEWLNFGMLSLQDKVAIGIVDNIIELWTRGLFFSGISSVTSTRLLTDVYNKTGENYFLIRFSMARKPFFDLEGIYTDQGNEPVLYKTLIMYDTDPVSKKPVFWVDTQNDSKVSKSFSLVNIISYVSNRTRWRPLSTDFYDRSGLPMTSLNSNNNGHLGGPGSNFNGISSYSVNNNQPIIVPQSLYTPNTSITPNKLEMPW